MRGKAVRLAVLLVLLTGTYADAREPFDDARVTPQPAEPRPDPVPFVVPPGLYYVTDTYVGSVVATMGATTTYSTATVHESTGTYARVIDTVGTGAPSAFDGLAFNGRSALTDGRALAGTYYENFVLTDSGYVPVSIVFFQDDSETRRAGVRPSSSPAATAPSSIPGPAATAPSSTPGPAAGSSSSPAFATARPTSRPTMPTAPPRPRLTAGVALGPDGPALASAEVLRGKLIQFWPRAFANDRPVAVRSWHLLSAEPDRFSARDGTTEPLVAQWIEMPAPGVPWTLRLEVFTDLAPAVPIEAQIAITVRSPALID